MKEVDIMKRIGFGVAVVVGMLLGGIFGWSAVRGYVAFLQQERRWAEEEFQHIDKVDDELRALVARLEEGSTHDDQRVRQLESFISNSIPYGSDFVDNECSFAQCLIRWSVPDTENVLNSDAVPLSPVKTWNAMAGVVRVRGYYATQQKKCMGKHKSVMLLLLLTRQKRGWVIMIP